jgi:hypothetical protein
MCIKSSEMGGEWLRQKTGKRFTGIYAGLYDAICCIIAIIEVSVVLNFLEFGSLGVWEFRR